MNNSNLYFILFTIGSLAFSWMLISVMGVFILDTLIPKNLIPLVCVIPTIIFYYLAKNQFVEIYVLLGGELPMEKEVRL